jgi:hypothetical protein
MKKHWWILLCLTFFWPLLQLVIYFARFGIPPANLYLESLSFAPVGLVSGWIALYLFSRSEPKTQKRAIVIGYIVMVPVATLMALGGGLMLPPWIGPAVFGVIPLALGMGIGFWIGGMLGKNEKM